jgi:hypothetical protein
MSFSSACMLASCGWLSLLAGYTVFTASILAMNASDAQALLTERESAAAALLAAINITSKILCTRLLFITSSF